MNKNMTKVLALLLVVCTMCTLLVSCGKKEYKLGMGAVISLDSSKDGAAQVDGTLATVVTDNKGKIVLCRVDAIQNKVTVNEDGTFTITNTKTKMELGDDYNMAKYGHSLVGNETVKEWYDQAKAFEAWCVGKTVDEVKGMATQTMDNGYVISADKALLDAGCTISITDFVNAVVKACNDDQGVSFKAKKGFTLGIAANSADAGSKDGVIKVHSDFAATVLDKDGKILASLNDAIQPNVEFDATGKLVAKTFQATKRELKENYNMSKYGHSLIGAETVAEWYVQSAAFSAHVAGKTADEVKNLPTQTMDKGYIISSDKALLDAGCTMSIDAIIDVVVKSATNAR